MNAECTKTGNEDGKNLKKICMEFSNDFGLANDYPLIEYKGKINYVSTYDEISSASQKILDWVEEQTNDKIPIAIDIEWPVSYCFGEPQERTALIQLCAKSDECFVFHVINIEKLPDVLITLLIHSKVILHGIKIKGDLRKLQKDFPGVPNKIMEQCKDLGSWCNEVWYTAGCWSMEKLVWYLCKLRINKNLNLRTRNWDEFPLTDEQKLYAAIDVYIALDIYNKLNEKNEENIARLNASIQEIGPKAARIERKIQLASQRAFRAANKAYSQAKKLKLEALKLKYKSIPVVSSDQIKTNIISVPVVATDPSDDFHM